VSKTIGVLSGLVAIAVLHFSMVDAADPSTAAKPASKMTYGQGVELLPHAYQGPFVTMPDGAILGIEENTVIRSTDGGATWTKSEIFSDKQKAELNLKISNERALVLTRDGSLVLGCMNLNSRKWTWDKNTHDAPGAVLATWAMRSTDGGKTWTDVQKLHDDWTGAVRDLIQTKSGRLVMTSMKLLHDPGRHSVLAYVSDDDGRTWKPGNLIDLGGAGHHGGVTEPTVVELKDGRVWMLIRTNWGEFWSGYSTDGGRFYRELRPSGIAASSAPAIVKRLGDGRLAMAWNRLYPEGETSFPLRGGDNEWSEVPVSNHRGELSLAYSSDEGATWTKPVVIAREPGKSLAYPYIYEPTPGTLWITTMQGGVRVRVEAP
jgi:Neuraminidase (sialidase)